ncbi:MAG: SpoIIE family protein phosphatase [Litorilinea sp.]
MTPKLEVHIAVSKVGKYASRESGDTVEIVERPHGGFSAVMADGQRSGRSAKAISNIVVRKAISLLAEGVRDGAVARATHDYLVTHRSGKVSAELHIISVDLVTRTMVVSRNARCPAFLRVGETCTWLDAEANAVGIHRFTKPAITELELLAETTLIAFSDGIWSAGRISGPGMNLPNLVTALDPDHRLAAQQLADGVLAEALRLDQSRPHDDATVVVFKIIAPTTPDEIRRLSMQIPLEG